MTQHAPCTFNEAVISGIQVLYLENELLKVSVLAGKGADVFELIYKPLNMDFLLKTTGGLDAFQHRNLSEQRLKMYSELYAGGWQDCLPHRARYKNIEITQEMGGIAATLPWAYEVVTDSAETVSVRCFVQLPDIPLDVEKIFVLKQGDPRLYVDIQIRNRGDAAVQFTWTQHPAFGGQFLDEHVAIEVPDCKVFHPRKYDRAYKSDLGRYEEPLGSVTMADGSSRDLREVQPKQANEQLFVVLKDIREPWAKLVNRDKGAGILLKWQLDAFPYIRYWIHNDDNLYTVGIEPSNDAFSSLDDSLEHGTFRELQPGQAYSTDLVCELFETEGKADQ